MNPRALIAEDEPVLAQVLRSALQRLWPALDVVEMASNGVLAVERTLALRPDVLFLDIKMPGKTGLDAAQELAEEWPDDAPFPLIVFVTAYDEYALQAFEQAALDYVLKPVNDARLEKTIERLRARLTEPAQIPKSEQSAQSAQSTQSTQSTQRAQSAPDDALERIVEQLRMLAPAPKQAERLRVIRAAVGSQIRLIPIDEVLYFEAADKYVNVVTASGESLIRASLKELLPQLDADRFWQIHRGTVVNIDYVDTATRDESGKLTLTLRGCKAELRVSRVFAHLFRQM